MFAGLERASRLKKRWRAKTSGADDLVEKGHCHRYGHGLGHAGVEAEVLQMAEERVVAE